MNMAGRSLQIDDDYCARIGNYFVTQGNEIDILIDEYITILQSIRKDAIKSGEVADALDVYISYASKMKNQIGTISRNAKQQVNNFINAVDAADQYLF